MFQIATKTKIVFLLMVSVSYTLLLLIYNDIPDQRFHISFLDVGQGDSIFIKTPENHQILIDGGPGDTVFEELSDVMSFFDKSLDLIVLTHPDKDHIAGLVQVLKRYRVQNVLLTGVNDNSFYYDEFLREIDRQGSNLFWADEKTDFKLGKIIIDVIYPFEQSVLDDVKKTNNSSIAMLVYHDLKKILLTGDLEAEAEEAITRRVQLPQVDILKLGHHGSKSSSAENFLKLIKPEIVVIQVGKNSYGHPHFEVLERLKEVGISKIYRTDVDGKIEFHF